EARLLKQPAKLPQLRREAALRSRNSRWRELRKAGRSGIPAMPGGTQARRRPRRSAALFLEREFQQWLHRHGRCHLPIGPVFLAVPTKAAAGSARSRPRLCRIAALEIPVRAARPWHLPQSKRPGLRRRREKREKPDAR